MNNSTNNVTLLTGYIIDVVESVKELGHSTEELESIMTDFPLDNPFKQLPIEIYNKACDWVEQELGEEKLLAVGKKVGERAYSILVENHIIEKEALVPEIIEGLEIAASTTIQDPEERGWEVLYSSDNRIVLKRTQTFNSKLQLGLLKGLVAQCPTVNPESISIAYLAEVAKGDEFDEYEVVWKYVN